MLRFLMSQTEHAAPVMIPCLHIAFPSFYKEFLK